MRFLLLLLLVTPLLATAHAADLNGYSARYECRAGNPNCDVDVAALAAKNCDQTITPSTTPTTDWSAINWTNDVICIQVGDYSGRGKFTLGASGTSGRRKVVKGVKAGGALADLPWSVESGSRVHVRSITCESKDFVVVTRLWSKASPTDSPSHRAHDCSNTIFHEILIDNENPINTALFAPFDIGRSGGESTNFTLQNSVVRNSGKATDTDKHCVYVRSNDVRIVNNEIYNCGGDAINIDSDVNAFRVKIENNDIYQGSDYLIGCDGNPGTTCNCGEDGIDIKSNNTTNPNDRIEVVHNRFWGWRTTYESCSGSGSAGFAVNAGGTGPKNFVLIKDNTIADVSNGVNMRSNTSYWTVVGNLFYDVNHAHTPQDAPNNGDGEYSIALRLSATHNHKIYLNTTVDTKYALWVSGGATNNDLRCNVFVNVLNINRDSVFALGSGSIANYNAFYSTNPTHWPSSDTDFSIIRASVDDAKAQPYCYSRKLRTGPENTCAPYAQPTANSPHYKACDPTLDIGTGF